ncbi:hypothetical protein [Bdellovibrio reynosensis]|uniref:Uncharacterized protein n=1 Tax=Bdellovibrio reynosensis TaxID=2835041 RepID=A0ABY4C4X4_9BACT|nr:hypothetical protein [Bdellovibrio reynosensis]UOE99783.1 hypothetical protein MNR06_08750 [Bdellovibrio reynosensis]
MTQWFFLATIPFMRWSCILSICLLTFALSANATTPQRAFLEQFKSSRISFPPENSPLLGNSPGRYSYALNFVFENLLSWTPDGKTKEMSSHCVPAVWQERMMDPRLAKSAQLQGALVQKYFSDCKADLSTGDTGYFTNLVSMMSMKYQPQEHPFLRRVVFNLPGNVKLKGLLALKGDFKRRPFVIVRTGIFSSIEDFKPERAWLMMLFEQSPFNVVMVENMSSSDFVANNSQFSFGGYDEGIQNLLIAKLLKNPDEPISQIVDSVHVFGVSLGGHGVLFSSLLNKYNSGKTPLINSFTALCPVVQLQPTMLNLTHGGFKSVVVDLWSRQRLLGLDQKLPALLTHDNFAFLSKAITEIARTYKGGLSYISSVQLPPGMKDGNDFWGLNDFWKYYKNVEEPVLIYATQEDPAVPYFMNSQLLQNKTIKYDSKNIRVIDLPEGVHCTLPIPYEWSAFTGLFQSYVLSHSPNFQMSQQGLEVELSDDEWAGFFDKNVKLHFEVQEPGKKVGFVTVEITFENSKGKEKTMSLSLPLSQFDFRFLNKQMHPSEQEMMVRWLNQNLKLTWAFVKSKPVLKASWPIAL